MGEEGEEGPRQTFPLHSGLYITPLLHSVYISAPSHSFETIKDLIWAVLAATKEICSIAQNKDVLVMLNSNYVKP